MLGAVVLARAARSPAPCGKPACGRSTRRVRSLGAVMRGRAGQRKRRARSVRPPVAPAAATDRPREPRARRSQPRGQTVVRPPPPRHGARKPRSAQSCVLAPGGDSTGRGTPARPSRRPPPPARSREPRARQAVGYVAKPAYLRRAVPSAILVIAFEPAPKRLPGSPPDARFRLLKNECLQL
jgi:hypothetical protein